ncbi:hypothetical protein MKX03_032356 [Papaver bracteatum]|nr:hypothetical protein MKX03_032356 [Papaver bracteatum]
MNKKVEDPLSGYVLVSAPHGTYCGQWQLSLSFISGVSHATTYTTDATLEKCSACCDGGLALSK